jgi:hypothetical protein
MGENSSNLVTLNPIARAKIDEVTMMLGGKTIEI